MADTSSRSGRALALAALILGMAMAMLDVTIVNVALPTLRESLNADEATLSWIISGYALAGGLALIPAGRLGDRVGHKPVFIVGITVFTLASLWCGLSTSDLSLVAARVVQGLGAGTFGPAVAAMIQLMYTGRARGRAFAVMGATMGLFTAMGPMIGGLLIQWLGDQDGWRSIFYVNVPLGAIAIVGAIVFLPSGGEDRSKAGMDWPGLVFVTLGILGILVPLIEGQDLGWPAWTWLCMAAGVALLVVFAWWQLARARAGRSQLVPPHLFSHRAFTGGVLLAFVYFAAFTSIFFTISIFWQAGLGHTALESGLVSLPFSIGSIVGASQGERLVHHLGRATLVIGTACVAAGLLAIWAIVQFVDPLSLTLWHLAAPMAIAGLGNGLFIAPNVQFIVATVDRPEAGAASGVVNVMQRLGTALGIAVVGTVFFGLLDEGSLARAGQETAARHDPSIMQSALAHAFGTSAAGGLLVSALFAVAAFALVWALPRRLATEHVPGAGPGRAASPAPAAGA